MFGTRERSICRQWHCRVTFAVRRLALQAFTVHIEPFAMQKVARQSLVFPLVLQAVLGKKRLQGVVTKEILHALEKLFTG
jgi:hypothetical protein